MNFIQNSELCSSGRILVTIIKVTTIANILLSEDQYKQLPQNTQCNYLESLLLTYNKIFC